VNKGDREGCDRFVMELKFSLELRKHEAGWHFPILKTIATEEKGIEKLVLIMETHQDYLMKSGKFAEERKAKLKLRINELIEEKIKLHVMENIVKEHELNAIVDKIYKRKLNPYAVANRIAKSIIKPHNRQK